MSERASEESLRVHKLVLLLLLCQCGCVSLARSFARLVIQSTSIGTTGSDFRRLATSSDVIESSDHQPPLAVFSF